jgi:hypothetical protein
MNRDGLISLEARIVVCHAHPNATLKLDGVSAGIADHLFTSRDSLKQSVWLSNVLRESSSYAISVGKWNE